ncbi:ABC transporter ATP-binding protein [Sabulilitoribacter arenilitoris]|uniref:ABC transporter ATP-binding protein n=1 Tax=Wocania arenilitoris TaxID=2044858 RepID=A0AAE3JLH0_9FLAO|nr:ABC transporter ATP-binding protein [Wocania arenilitoris]MCF7568269.1 ABC transporter ATP-binding protein [Wocania arenilitoris]
MLEATNLSKEYNNFSALNNLNIKVEAGDIYCLLGANGAGKSTTINLFLGFIEATKGSVSINGLDVSKKNMETKKYLSYIPENLMLYPTLTGLENLEYFVGLAKKKYNRAEFIDFLTEAGLQANAHTKRVSAYSKGMRQKVGIAIALAKDAKVLLLDEPTSGLDPRASNEFSNLLLTLKDKGVATLMATHDIFRAKQIATHIGIMKEGRLVESFKSEDISLKELEDLYLETIDS